MRQHKKNLNENAFSILTLDDDPIMTSTVQAYFQRSGYRVDTENDPYAAIERIRNGHYDILLLDFLMSPICGDQVVEQIRQFNKELFIILLTGHKSMAPPIKTIRALDIQGYYEKSDRFDQLELLVESCVKSIKQMRMLRNYEKELSAMVDNLNKIYHLQSQEKLSKEILNIVGSIVPFTAGFVAIENTGEMRIFGTGERVSESFCCELLGKAQWEDNHIAFVNGWCLMHMVDENQKQLGAVGIIPKKSPERPELQLLSILSRQASAAILNNYLHGYVNLQNQRLEEAYMQTIETLRFTVETRDKETKGHSARVSSLASGLARTMTLS